MVISVRCLRKPSGQGAANVSLGIQKSRIGFTRVRQLNQVTMRLHKKPADGQAWPEMRYSKILITAVRLGIDK
jgi:hypothetical protein